MTLAGTASLLTVVGLVAVFITLLQIRDRLDAGAPQLGHVLLVSAHGEDPGVDSRMQCLDPAVEHLGRAGVVRDPRDRDALLAEQSRGPTTRDDLHVERFQHLAELDDSFLVVDADQSPADSILLHHGLPDSTSAVPGFQ